jgi:hypothetical protein
MKLFVRLLAVLLAASALPAFAQETPNAFRPVEIGWNLISYSRQGDANLYGGDLTFTFYPHKRIGIAADLAVHSGEFGGVDLDTVSYRFGPKWRTPLGGRFTHFGQVLFGGSRLTGSSTGFSGGTTNTSSVSTNGFAFALGGGIDLGIRPWVAWRMAQFDYSYLNFGTINVSSNSFRVGTGLVFRMGPH